MAIPAAYEMVKHYTVNVSDTTPKTVYFTDNGASEGIDFSTQADGQGMAVFIDNTAAGSVPLKVEAYSVIDLYDEEYVVKLGEFAVVADSEGAFAFGYGMIEKGFRLEITPASTPSSAYDVTVAMVPSNG